MTRPGVASSVVDFEQGDYLEIVDRITKIGSKKFPPSM